MQKAIIIIVVFILGIAVGVGGFYLYIQDRFVEIESLNNRIAEQRAEIGRISREYEQALIRAEERLGEREIAYIELAATVTDLERELRDRERRLGKLAELGREISTGAGEAGDTLRRAREILAKYLEAEDP